MRDAGRSHVLALTARGEVYSWGAGFYGRLGNGSSANSSVPCKVKFPTAVRVSADSESAKPATDTIYWRRALRVGVGWCSGWFAERR